MKKLFTLIAAAFVAMTMNAKETIDISTVATDGVIEFTGSWQWKGITLSTGNEDGSTTYADKSQWDYLLVRYSAGTCDFKVIAQYNPDGTTGDYGANYYQSEASEAVNANGGLVAVKLDKEHADKFNAVAFQNQSKAGSLTVVEAYFATEAEYEEAKAEADKIEKVNVMEESVDHKSGATAWGWDGVWKNNMDITGFNALVIEIASADGPGQIDAQVKDATGTQTDLKASIEQSTEPQTIVLDISQYNTLVQYAYQNANDAVTTFKVTKAYLTSKTAEEVTSVKAIRTQKTDVNAPLYNLAGQRVAKNYKGVVIQNGRKFINK